MSPSLPLRTRIVALAGLLAFVVGSNHCSIGAWRGDRGMSCLRVPSTSATPLHDCCRAAGRTAPANAPANEGSCCIDPGPLPESPTLATFAFSAIAFAIVPDQATAELPRESAAIARAPADRPPPALASPLPLQGRAPPPDRLA